MIADAFWDASVLVPLCIDQPPFTRQSESLIARYTITVWWGTSVDILSAMTRVKRAGVVTPDEFQQAKLQLEGLTSRWFAIKPTAKVKTVAAEVLEKYPLRAADALQLAAAMEWCEGKPNGLPFLTADRRLSEAAAQSGFTLEPGLILP